MDFTRNTSPKYVQKQFLAQKKPRKSPNSTRRWN